jgi:hypothetical protein
MAEEYDPEEAMEKSFEYLGRNKEQFGMGKLLNKATLKMMKAKTRRDIKKTKKETPNAYSNAKEIEVLFQDELIIKPIEELIALGEQDGMTLPRFLRIQIEKGMDKAMEGMILQREGYVFSYEFAKAQAFCPHYIEKEKRKIELYDKLASQSKFGVPNSQELTEYDIRIDYEFDPLIAKWDAIVERWENLLWSLSHWSLAHTSSAPHIAPWSMAENVQEAIRETKECRPGIFKQEEALFKKYFGLDFMDVFKHETFKYKVENNYIDQSQEFIEFLIEKVYPHCQPNTFLASDIVEERNAFYKDKKEVNPQRAEPIKQFRDFYDQKFGQGYYTSKYGEIETVEANAAAWNWESFKYKV